MKKIIIGTMGLIILITLFTAPPLQAQVPDTLYVKSLTLTTDILNREPVDTVSTFQPSDGNAYALIRVRNTGAPDTVVFKWIHNGETYFTFNSPVGNAFSWRTYTSVKTIPGNWTVQILDNSGEILAEKSFEIVQ